MGVIPPTVNIISTIRTPEKHGQLVLSPSLLQGTFDSHAVDCPFLFRHDGLFRMTYVGWDGTGYQTGMASSDNLLDWQKDGLIIARDPPTPFYSNKLASTSILLDNDFLGPCKLMLVSARFAGTYHAYPRAGYEAGPGVIGLCFSHDLKSWEIHDPVLSPDPHYAWEAGGLYKSWLMEWKGTYYLFYNAKNKGDWPWVEQTGLATSTDLRKWERFQGNPVLRLGRTGDFDDVFASDPCVLHHMGVWIMFYFGNSSDGHARDSAAFSDDLLAWRKSGEVLVDVGPEGGIDSRYAHKPGIIAHAGKLYHFYCAVTPATETVIGGITLKESRGIALATN